MNAGLMGSAIHDFYSGKSYKQIAEGIRNTTFPIRATPPSTNGSGTTPPAR